MRSIGSLLGVLLLAGCYSQVTATDVSRASAPLHPPPPEAVVVATPAPSSPLRQAAVVATPALAPSSPLRQAAVVATPALAPSSPPRQAAVVAVSAPPPVAAIATGDRVICDWKEGGVFYPGRVERADGSGSVFVVYDDGDREDTHVDRCLHEPTRTHPSGGGAVAPALPRSDRDGIAAMYRIAAASSPGDGTSYSGDVSISRTGDVYLLWWNIDNSSSYVGTGLLAGDVLGVGWGPGAAPGVVVYKVDGGKLMGKWASGAGAGVGEEDLDGPKGLNGKYRIVRGVNPDGSSYTGSVTITKKGDIYALAWSLPGRNDFGVGVLRGDVLSVGWGNGTAPGVVAYTVSGTSLDGTWASPGDASLGSEKLERK